MKVVVTGSRGFIGNALVEQLIRERVQVCFLVRSDGVSLQPGFKNLFYKYSLLECEESLKAWKPDFFFHLAWWGVKSSQRNLKELNNYNYQLAIESVKLAASSGCIQWIGAGSQAEYGIVNEVLSEENSCLPSSDYGITKKKICEEAAFQCERFGLGYAWGRIFSVYGPQDHKNTFISYLVQSMLFKEDLEVSSCTQMWDYLYITDAASALRSLISHQGIFNIASGKVIQLKEVVELTSYLTDFKGNVHWGRKNDGLLNYLCGDIGKINRVTEWFPKIDFKEGLQRTINGFKHIS